MIPVPYALHCTTAFEEATRAKPPRNLTGSFFDAGPAPGAMQRHELSGLPLFF